MFSVAGALRGFEQVSLGEFGEPVAVLLSGPAELDGDEVIQLRALEHAKALGGRFDGKPRPQGAGEVLANPASVPADAFLQQPSPQVDGELLSVGGATDDGVNRACAGEDAATELDVGAQPLP